MVRAVTGFSRLFMHGRRLLERQEGCRKRFELGFVYFTIIRYPTGINSCALEIKRKGVWLYTTPTWNSHFSLIVLTGFERRLWIEIRR